LVVNDGRGRREMLEVVGKVMMIITLLHRWERRQNAALQAPLVEPGELRKEDDHSPEVPALAGRRHVNEVRDQREVDGDK
jgi:hypothetical protein